MNKKLSILSALMCFALASCFDNEVTSSIEERQISFSIESSNNVYFLGEQELTFSISANSYLGSFTANDVVYYVDGEDIVQSSIVGNSFSASKPGKVIIKAKVGGVVSENEIQIAVKYSDTKISSTLEEILDKQLVFGQEYDVGIDSMFANDYTLSGADGILTINENGNIEAVGFGSGKIKLLCGNSVVYENYYNVRNSILCTNIKNDLIEKKIISSISDNVTSDMLNHITTLSLSGEIINDPESVYGVKYLENLENLDLSNNELKDLSFVSNLTKLKTIDLSNNKLTNIDYIVDNQDLKYIDLSNNNISDLKKIQHLHKIEYLDLSNNSVDNIDYLSNIYTLKSLFLNNNDISEFKDSLSGLSNLVELGLGYCGIEFTDIKSFNYIDNLTYLDISGTNPNMSSIGGLSKLTSLILQDCKLSEGKDLTKLNNLTNLVKLDISENQLSASVYNEALDPLKLVNIEELCIGGNEFLTIPNLAGFSKLDVLDLSNSYNLQSITELEALNISTLILDECNSISITDNGDEYLRVLDTLSNLSKLSVLSGFNYINQNIYQELNERVKNGLELRLFDEKWLNKDTIEDYSKTVYFNFVDFITSGCNLVDEAGTEYNLSTDSNQHIILVLLNDTNITSSYKFNVPTSVFHFEIYSNKLNTYDFHFNVLERKSSSINFSLHNFICSNSSSNYSDSLIKTIGEAKLIIDYYGTNKLSTSLYKNSNNEWIASSGQTVITCYDITINECGRGSTLTLKGQNGKSGQQGNDSHPTGAQGGNGSNLIECNSAYINAMTLNLISGNGGDGGPGNYWEVFDWDHTGHGGDGGDAGSGIVYKTSFSAKYNINFTSGVGGKGGSGQNYVTGSTNPGEDGTSGKISVNIVE